MSYVNNDGIRIHYTVDGSGPPLLLQHGLSDSVEGWYEFDYVVRLKSEFRLIMIDARGHGASDKPYDPAAYHPKLMVSDVLAVLNALKLEKVYYYGNSMGSRTGFDMAQHAPERIRAFILGGGHPYFGDMAIFRQIFAEGLTAWVDLIEQMAGPLSPATRRRLLSNDIEALRAFAAQDRPDISDVLATMSMRCRLFAGSLDERFPLVKQAACALPNGDFVPLFGLNHFQAYVRGDLVAPLITPYTTLFLNELEQASPISLGAAT